ncbi:hypothetical protein A0128_13255 [Leptospira tipperaryensis]|uniref:Uncharacterized protein n=1 Tax=Leptospira tipperaryensis TaxID=2564040 RepID=A0A1D7UYV1_9LEPT|nr:hypothetical protein A0128_13255 [Leptospira tipperaryensis]
MLEGPFRKMNSNPLSYRRSFCKKKNWTYKTSEVFCERKFAVFRPLCAREILAPTKDPIEILLKNRLEVRQTVSSKRFLHRFKKGNFNFRI